MFRFVSPICRYLGTFENSRNSSGGLRAEGLRRQVKGSSTVSPG